MENWESIFGIWEKYDVDDNDIWALKEKFKIYLKEWNKVTFGDLNKNKERIILSLKELEKKNEDNELDH